MFLGLKAGLVESQTHVSPLLLISGSQVAEPPTWFSAAMTMARDDANEE